MSTSAINPGLSSLLQTIENANPGLAAPAVQSAIENASPKDIVTLSETALQAQLLPALFEPVSPSISAPDTGSLLSSLIQSVTQETTP